MTVRGPLNLSYVSLGDRFKGLDMEGLVEPILSSCGDLIVRDKVTMDLVPRCIRDLVDESTGRAVCLVEIIDRQGIET